MKKKLRSWIHSPLYFHIQPNSTLVDIFSCIIDESNEVTPGTSVTNSVEQVLGSIANEIGVLPPIVIYKDTADEWDQLLIHSSGQFKAFAPIFTKSNNVKSRTKLELIAIQYAVTAMSDYQDIH